jgi:hypothetical protein
MLILVQVLPFSGKPAVEASTASYGFAGCPDVSRRIHAVYDETGNHCTDQKLLAPGSGIISRRLAHWLVQTQPGQRPAPFRCRATRPQSKWLAGPREGYAIIR